MNNSKIITHLGVIIELMEQKDFSEASTKLEELLQIYSTDPTLLGLAYECSLKQGDFSKATEIFYRSCEVNSGKTPKNILSLYEAFKQEAQIASAEPSTPAQEAVASTTLTPQTVTP